VHAGNRTLNPSNHIVNHLRYHRLIAKAPLPIKLSGRNQKHNQQDGRRSKTQFRLT
jgi:hypothetical protein